MHRNQSCHGSLNVGISACFLWDHPDTVNVAPARDEDKYSIAPPAGRRQKWLQLCNAQVAVGLTVQCNKDILHPECKGLKHDQQTHKAQDVVRENFLVRLGAVDYSLVDRINCEGFFTPVGSIRYDHMLDVQYILGLPSNGEYKTASNPMNHVETITS